MYEGKMKIRGQTGRRGDRGLCSAEAILLRYGLALSFLSIRAMKFTAYEAEGIRPLAENSPLMSWFVAALGIRPFWNLLGVIEIATGVLAALRPISARATVIGNGMGAAIRSLREASTALRNARASGPGSTPRRDRYHRGPSAKDASKPAINLLTSVGRQFRVPLRNSFLSHV
jgi:Protein of unknown function, DUF417